MTRPKIAFLFALALIVPACGGKKTIIQNITNGAPGSTVSNPFPVVGTSPAGSTGFSEDGGVGGLGSDGQPRTVYVTNSLGNLQVRFARRNPDGTWSPVLPISTNDADLKDQVTVIVSQNNNFTHIFWLQGATNAVYRLHYAQVNDNATPSLSIPDTIVSPVPATGVGIGATPGRVTTFATAIDPVSSNVTVTWIQAVTDGGTTTDVPLVDAVIGGAGNLSERFALISPTGAGVNHSTKLPILKVAANGRTHAAFSANFGGAWQIFHRLRTAPGTWSTLNPAAAVGVGSPPNITALDMVLAADGDAYIGWINNLNEIRAAYRAAGDATTFSPEVGVSSPGPTGKIITVLEPGTERLHIIAGKSKPLVDGFVITCRNTAANLAGAFETETLLSITTGNPAATPVDFFAWADSGNRVTVVHMAPPVQSDLPHLLAQTRPSGVGNGNYSPLKDITGAGAMPCFDLAVSSNLNGDAIIAWRQGQDHIIPLGEIYGALYTAANGLGGTFNLSNTPAVGSHGPIFVLQTDTGPGYVSWLEAVTSGPDTHDVYFALRP